MSDQSMHDLTGWQRVPCAVADLMRQAERVRWPLRVFSSLTDPEGNFGTPLVYTEWGIEHPDGDIPLLREYQFPADPAVDCAHYVPTIASERRPAHDPASGPEPAPDAPGSAGVDAGNRGGVVTSPRNRATVEREDTWATTTKEIS